MSKRLINKVKLELLNLKIKEYIFLSEYNKSNSEYKYFLEHKKIKENEITSKAIEIDKTQDRKFAVSVCLYFILSFISTLGFNKIFITLEIGNQIGSLIIATLFNLGIGVPILYKKLKHIFKENEKRIDDLSKEKDLLTENMKRLSDIKNIALIKYLNTKKQVEKKEKLLTKLNNQNYIKKLQNKPGTVLPYTQQEFAYRQLTKSCNEQGEKTEEKAKLKNLQIKINGN